MEKLAEISCWALVELLMRYTLYVTKGSTSVNTDLSRQMFICIYAYYNNYGFIHEIYVSTCMFSVLFYILFVIFVAEQYVYYWLHS